LGTLSLKGRGKGKGSFGRRRGDRLPLAP
jgi:hypothetical protein